MEMYWALLLTPTALSAFRMHRNLLQVTFALVFIFFVFAVGLREHVGMDWSNYEAIYNSLYGATLDFEDLKREPAFYLINYLAHQLELGVTFVNVTHAIIFLGGLFYFAYKRCPEKFLALAIATPYLVVVIGMSGIRQAAAIGVFMYLLAIWNRVGMFTKITLLVVASTFHTSAILLAALLIVEGNRNPIKLLIVASAAMGIGLYIIGGSDDYYMSSYVTDNLQSPGSALHSLLIVAPATIFIALRRRFEESGLYDPLIYKMAILSICMFPLLAISSTGVDRFMLYFTPVQMYALSSLRRTLRNSGVIAAIAIFNSLVLYTWLVYANNSDAWSPYTSCLQADAGCFHQ